MKRPPSPKALARRLRTGRRIIADERDAAFNPKTKRAPANPYGKEEARLEDREGYPFAGKPLEDREGYPFAGKPPVRV